MTKDQIKQLEQIVTAGADGVYVSDIQNMTALRELREIGYVTALSALFRPLRYVATREGHTALRDTQC
ncbi:MAG TPA: hypothetical protein PK205_06985 [Promineifilum sp.]|nr:hypothetical protein [Promineifilum sp.]